MAGGCCAASTPSCLGGAPPTPQTRHQPPSSTKPHRLGSSRVFIFDTTGFLIRNEPPSPHFSLSHISVIQTHPPHKQLDAIDTIFVMKRILLQTQITTDPPPLPFSLSVLAARLPATERSPDTGGTGPEASWRWERLCPLPRANRQLLPLAGLAEPRFSPTSTTSPCFCFNISRYAGPWSCRQDGEKGGRSGNAAT